MSDSSKFKSSRIEKNNKRKKQLNTKKENWVLFHTSMNQTRDFLNTILENTHSLERVSDNCNMNEIEKCILPVLNSKILFVQDLFSNGNMVEENFQFPNIRFSICADMIGTLQKSLIWEQQEIFIDDTALSVYEELMKCYPNSQILVFQIEYDYDDFPKLKKVIAFIHGDWGVQKRTYEIDTNANVEEQIPEYYDQTMYVHVACCLRHMYSLLKELNRIREKKSHEPSFFKTGEMNMAKVDNLYRIEATQILIREYLEGTESIIRSKMTNAQQFMDFMTLEFASMDGCTKNELSFEDLGFDKEKFISEFNNRFEITQ